MSFDIGIKNMAFCILEKSLDHDIIITDWQVIDISTSSSSSSCSSSSSSSKETCNCINKTGKLCGKNAKYYKEKDFFCERHLNSSKWMMPTIRKNLQRQKIVDLIALNAKFSFCLWKENEKIKKKDMIDRIELFFQEKSAIKIKTNVPIIANQIDLITIGRNMKLILDTIKNIDTINHIIIENQISPLANRMKTIQGMLAQYFIMKLGSDVTISFISSQNKLKLFKQPKQKKETDLEKKSEIEGEREKESFMKINEKIKEKQDNYGVNKKEAVSHTIEILKKNIHLMKWLPLLLTKKKDDLSDCFLQGIWYMHHLKIITNVINYKIE